MSSLVLAIVVPALLAFGVAQTLKQKRDRNAKLADFGARRMEENLERRDLQLEYLYGVAGMALPAEARRAVFARSLAVLAAHLAEPDFQQAFLRYFTRCRWGSGEREAACRTLLGLLREDSPPNVRRFVLEVARGHRREIGNF